MKGLNILITGATDGIGEATARVLADAGARVAIHGRNPEKVKSVASAIGKVHAFVADLASLAETAKMAEDVAAALPDLDVLVNNAGVGTGGLRAPRETSRDGHELRFAVNYLAPFLLTRKLLAMGLPRKAIINVSSIGQERIDFDDVMLERRYSGGSAYCRSKLAQILFTIDVAESHPKLVSYALHPGTYLDTNMVRQASVRPLGPATRGADSVAAAIEKAFVHGAPSGSFFDEQELSRANAQAYDPAARAELRRLSEALTKSYLAR